MRVSIDTPVAAQSPVAVHPSRCRLCSQVHRRHAQLPSSAATATLACSTSSNGSTSSPTICPVSWPLPADQQRIAGAQRIDAAQDRLGPVAHFGAHPGSRLPCTAARIAAGSSERGLSSVTITTSACLRRRLPHQRALARIAVAACADNRNQTAHHMRAHRLAARSQPHQAYGHNRQRPPHHCRASRPVASGPARLSAAAGCRTHRPDRPRRRSPARRPAARFRPETRRSAPAASDAPGHASQSADPVPSHQTAGPSGCRSRIRLAPDA